MLVCGIGLLLLGTKSGKGKVKTYVWQHLSFRMADLMREAVRRVRHRPRPDGPVALWDGIPTRTSVEHDTIYEEH